MTTVTIYEITCTRGFQMCETGVGYSLEPWGDNTVIYEGCDDGGEQYALPEGYALARDGMGDLVICDSHGRDGILINDNGHPAIDTGYETIRLQHA